MSNFYQHADCSVCGSADNLSVYWSNEFDDYHTWTCFTPGCTNKRTDRDIELNLSTAPKYYGDKQVAKQGRDFSKAEIALKRYSTAASAASYAKSRGIDPKMYELYGIKYDEQYNCIMYPVKDDKGKTIYFKYRLLKEKDFRINWVDEGDALFGMQLCSGDFNLIITEGQDDAVAAKQMIPNASVVSVSNASAALTEVDKHYEWISKFKTVYLCLDADEAGAKAASDIASKYGSFKVMVLPEGCKDANDCLKQNKLDLFKKSMYQAALQQPAYEVNNTKLRAEAIAYYSRPEDELIGLPTGVEQIDKLIGGFRTNELTLLFGGLGIGKSVISRQVMLAQMRGGSNVLVLSSEEVERKWIGDLTRMAYGVISEDNINKFFEEFEGKFTFIKYSAFEADAVPDLLKSIEGSVLSKNINFLIFDNITHVSKGASGLGAAHIVCNSIMHGMGRITTKFPIHVWCVGHVLKKDNVDGVPPNESSIDGGGSPGQFSTNMLGFYKDPENLNERRIILVKRREHFRVLDTNTLDSLPLKYDKLFGCYVQPKAKDSKEVKKDDIKEDDVRQPTRGSSEPDKPVRETGVQSLEAVLGGSASSVRSQPRLPRDEARRQRFNARTKKWRERRTTGKALVKDIKDSVEGGNYTPWNRATRELQGTDSVVTTAGTGDKTTTRLDDWTISLDSSYVAGIIKKLAD